MDQRIPTREDCIRMAAFIDGEGCIAIRKFSDVRKGTRRHSYIVELAIYNTDPRLTAWCKEVFGGNVVVTKKDPKYKPSQPLFQWRVTCAKAEAILRLCLDFFLIKREQADIALKYRETVNKKYRHSGVPREVSAERTGLHLKLALVKKPWLETA